MPLPRVQPIIPTWRKEPFDDPSWLFEVKYDDLRALLYLEKRNTCRLLWGRGKPLSRFDALCNQIAAELDFEDAILDGEVIAANETGRLPFSDRHGRARGPIYAVFDLLWLNGADQRCLPLSERRRRLRTILSARSPTILEALYVEGRGRELFQLMRTKDLEGIVAKRLDDPYNPRVRWLKINNPGYSHTRRGENCPVCA